MCNGEAANSNDSLQMPKLTMCSNFVLAILNLIASNVKNVPVHLVHKRCESYW